MVEESSNDVNDGIIIWVFNGAGSKFPNGVFRSRERAEQWIRSNGLTGVLTAYPLDTGIYDWAIERGFFRPRREDQALPDFIQRFSSAYLEHYHYTAGNPDHTRAAVTTK